MLVERSKALFEPPKQLIHFTKVQEMLHE